MFWKKARKQVHDSPETPETTEQNLTPEQQELINQYIALLEKEAKIVQGMEEDYKEANKNMGVLGEQVTEMAKRAEQTFAELDQAEKEASDGLDKILLQQAEDLAEDDE